MKNETSENKTKGKIVTAYCASCENENKHEILQSVQKFSEELLAPRDQDSLIYWSSDYQIIECRGCESTSFRSTHIFSEEDGTIINLYPKRTSTSLNSKGMYNVPARLRRFYKETIDAYNFDSNTLCAAGLRALVEGICAEYGVKKGEVTINKDEHNEKKVILKNLEGKISGLNEHGILTKSNAEILHELRFLGNDAVHELSIPSSNNLLLAIKILEHTLEALYEIPETGAELRSKRERREKKSKQSKK
ncbi:hypothetical protein CA11_47280 [Gimesia maris]|uniref:DUF4145 domain-containing protein n=1 Tax=Gimesia maris TaxID=122 RepID=UPI001187DE82|nr:DUF4145 domain-containing protein [Gimesia maris]QDU16891.1 hypothetical protein CA11_47280 [Gimesia maris]